MVMIQKQSPGGVLPKRCSQKLLNIPWKRPVPEPPSRLQRYYKRDSSLQLYYKRDSGLQLYYKRDSGKVVFL